MKSLGRKPEGARLERIKASPLWAGERFRNVHPILPGLRDPNAAMPTIGDFLCGGERRIPRAPLPSMNPLEAWGRPPASGLRATWLGHSTVLIEIDGLRVLTDPVWGRRASRGLGRAARAHRRARMVGIAPVAEHRAHGDRRALAAFFRTRAARPQRDLVVLARHPFATARSILQRRYGPHDGIPDDSRTARSVRPRHARGGRIPSCLGRHPPP